MNKKESSITIQWDGKKAAGFFIPRSIAGNIPNDSIKIYLVKKEPRIVVLGEYTMNDEGIIFKPLVPFTRGLKYEIRSGNKLLDEIEIPAPDPADAPTIVAVYPTTDTLPENLLKIHIVFSKPMQEGRSLQHVMMIRNGSDTIPVFLDLQPELWDRNNELLTLWLDPGRIKRDLQPNKNIGPPLTKDEHYELIISKDWEDTEGLTLREVYRKKFIAGQRDNASPDPAQWNIIIPKPGNRQALEIQFKEPLDYVLLKNALVITDSNGNAVQGTLNAGDKERSALFIPNNTWKAGKYFIEIEERLEDQAGNNLVRLFDNDLDASAKKVIKNRIEVVISQ